MNKFTVGHDEEIRTELIRLYLEQWHPAYLAQLQDEVRDVTNHIVRSRKDVKNARIAYARRHGLVGEPPVFPVEPSLPKPGTTEAKREVKEAWNLYYEAKKVAGKEYATWLASVFRVTKGIPELEWRKDKYQDLRSIYYRAGDAVLYRDTVKRVNATKLAKSKKASDHVPLVWRSSSLVETGSFYGDRRGVPFYNALVKVRVSGDKNP